VNEGVACRGFQLMLTPQRWSSGQFEDGLVRVAQDGDSVIGFAVLLAPVTVAALAGPRTLLAAEATVEKPSKPGDSPTVA
jgi:hypothetical protein